MRTTGPLGIFQVPLKLLRLLTERGQTVLPEKEEERHPGHPGQLGGKTGRQLTRLIELQGEEQTGLGLELVGILLQGPQDFRGLRDGKGHSSTFTAE